METVSIFGLPALLLILAFVANRLSRLTRVPDLIVLLLMGIALGPALHLVNPQMFKGAIHILGMLALTLILFEGGLELRLRQAVRYFPAGVLMVVMSFGLSMGLIALIGRSLLHLGWLDCLLLGAALGCTSGTIVIPTLQQIAAPEAVKVTLTIEAALGEVIAVLIVGSMLTLVPNQSVITGLALDFSQNIIVAVIIGLVCALIWSRLWPLAAPQPYSNVLNLGIVLGVFAITRYAGGSSLLAELVFGITLANMPLTPHAMRQGVRMMAFHSELSFLVRSFFFVMLGVVAEFIGHSYIIPIVGILAAMVLARFLAAQLIPFVIPKMTRREAELLFWMLPRGLVTAVLALEIVAARGAVFTFLPAVAFTVVLVSNFFIICGAIRCGRAPTVAQGPSDEASVVEGFKSAVAATTPAGTE